MVHVIKSFEVLGLPATATFEEAKSAYRELALIMHPDKHMQNESLMLRATEKFKELQDAWRIVQEYYKYLDEQASLEAFARMEREAIEKAEAESAQAERKDFERRRREEEIRSRENEAKRERERRERERRLEAQMEADFVYDAVQRRKEAELHASNKTKLMIIWLFYAILCIYICNIIQFFPFVLILVSALLGVVVFMTACIVTKSVS